MTTSFEAPAVPAAEFAERRRRAIARASEEGLDGLLVCARGGGALDRYGDIFYLTNHYSSFPFIPDLPGAWTGRAHAFLVMVSGDEPTLVVDIPSIEAIEMPRDRIVVADLVTEAVIDALKRAISKGRIGLVGGDALPMPIGKALEAAVPQLEFVPADHILAGLRAIKSPAEIAKLRAASRLGSRITEAMMEAAVPGATHGDVVAAGLNVLVPARGALYNCFMASGRGGPNPTLTRCNFPTWGSKQPLAEGEWFRVGISGVLDGYCFDLSRSRPVGKSNPEQVEAFEAAIAVIDAGIAAMRRRGATAGDVARAGQKTQQELGFAWKGVFSGLGHGLGLGWDSPWLVPDEPTAIVPGMVMCIEKTLMRNGWLGDFEETVVVTGDGPQLITDARRRFW
jgi:Xaa-Pro aminopeptidase